MSVDFRIFFFLFSNFFTIHDFLHAISLLSTLHFITFYQPISNELKGDSLLNAKKNMITEGAKRNSDIVYAMRIQLSWTHLRSLMFIKDPPERQFYAQILTAEFGPMIGMRFFLHQ